MNILPAGLFVSSQADYRGRAWAAIFSRWLLGVLTLVLEFAAAAQHPTGARFLTPSAVHRPVVLADSSTALAMPLGDPSISDAYSPTASISEPSVGSLDIVVHGVVAGSPQGFALVSVNGKSQDTFSTGDEIMPGARLIAVLPDRIVIERGRNREAYRLRGAGRFGAWRMTHPNTPAQPNDARGAVNRSVSQFSISRTALASQLRSPQELLSQAVVVPTPEGMLLREIDTGSLIITWGLQQGDVLVSINGQHLRSTDDMRRSYEQIRQAKQVRLEIQRSGKPESLFYHID
jgi:general secretion pathway protein C